MWYAQTVCRSQILNHRISQWLYQEYQSLIYVIILRYYPLNRDNPHKLGSIQASWILGYDEQKPLHYGSYGLIRIHAQNHQPLNVLSKVLAQYEDTYQRLMHCGEW